VNLIIFGSGSLQLWSLQFLSILVAEDQLLTAPALFSSAHLNSDETVVQHAIATSWAFPSEIQPKK
jgi:hypothetical protein